MRVVEDYNRDLLGNSQTLRHGQGYKVYEWMASLGLKSAVEVATYGVFSSYSLNGERETCCSYTHIAEMTCSTTETIRHTVRSLEDKQLIIRVNKRQSLPHIKVRPQSINPGARYTYIKSWVPAYMPIDNPTQLLTWTQIHSFSNGEKTVEFSRSEIVEFAAISSSTVTRTLTYLQSKGILEHYSVNKIGGGKLVRAKTVIPLEIEKLLETKGQQAVNSLNERSISANATSKANDLNNYNHCREKVNNGTVSIKSTTENDQLEVPKVHFVPTESNNKDNYISDIESSSDENEACWQKLLMISIKPPNKNKQVAYGAYKDAIAMGETGKSIVEKYEKYKDEYWSTNSTTKYAKRLDKWLTEPGGLWSFQSGESIQKPDQETKPALSFLVALYSSRAPELAEWAREFREEGTTEERKRELAAKIRNRCDELQKANRDV